ncbi:MAG: uroporphyrinogen-III synthase [Paraglaciecola sp.]|jgi:uroporphyrinogen-III synthase
MKKVFISRDLKSDSIFKQLLENQGFEIFGQSLISFNSVNFNLPEKPDWLFFYSKSGVLFFLLKVDIGYFATIKIAAIGEGTGAFLKSKNLMPHFIGNGEPKETARQFSKVANRSRVLFPRAKNSLKSVQSMLNGSIEVLDLIVYENAPKTDLKIGDFDVLIFTSPMNAMAYFENKELLDNQQVIAIGLTTLNALQNLGIEHGIVAKNPSEKALAEAVLLF